MRDRVVRDRVAELRLELLLRALPPLLDLRAVGLAAVAPVRLADERLAPVPDDFARLVPERLAADAEREALERTPVLRAPVARVGFFRELVLRDVLERVVVERALLGLLDDDARAPPPPVLAASPPSSVHLPDITRCAASATASAISEPRRDALETTLLAACWAVSAASSPASRILRRAAGLALIAAAAAANPAAIISRLIAAFASLSTVLSSPRELEDDFLDPVRLVDFAIANLPSVRDQRHFNGSTVPFRARTEPRKCTRLVAPDMLKGTADNAAIPSNMVSGRK